MAMALGWALQKPIILKHAPHAKFVGLEEVFRQDYRTGAALSG
jgi:hypothetical protein